MILLIHLIFVQTKIRHSCYQLQAVLACPPAHLPRRHPLLGRFLLGCGPSQQMRRCSRGPPRAVHAWSPASAHAGILPPTALHLPRPSLLNQQSHHQHMLLVPLLCDVRRHCCWTGCLGWAVGALSSQKPHRHRHVLQQPAVAGLGGTSYEMRRTPVGAPKPGHHTASVGWLPHELPAATRQEAAQALRHPPPPARAFPAL